jgi:dihydroxy-acid dehydratase
VVELARRWYEQDDARCCRRSIASFEAFENAMSLDIAMGGSTNTVLHLLAAAHEAGVPFTMADIDRLSRKVPNLCKVAPATQKYHMEDVHRAGGVIGILGELDRAGLMHREVPTVHSRPWARPWSAGTWRGAEATPRRATSPPPGGCPPRWPSASERWPELDLDRAEGCIRDWSTPTAATAGSPCSTATSPRTAAS